jgi:hypothetical protein
LDNETELNPLVSEEEEIKPLITAKLTYQCGGVQRDKLDARLFKDVLELSGPGFSRTLKLNTISAVEAASYKVFIRHKKGDITLSMLGHLYEDFVRHLVRTYNEIVFNESLMSEKTHFEAQGQYVSPTGETAAAVFRICETALVILPQTHALVRIPFCLMASVKNEPYRFSILDKMGRVYVLQKLGFSTDNFLREFKAREAELIRQTKEKLGGIAPVSDELARLMMEGLVVSVDNIRAVSAPFADALEARLTEQIPQEYGYLKSVSGTLAVGIKRGLMGSLTGESIILLAPARNKVIMESLGESAAATYVFDMGGSQWQAFLPAFNESMLAVNFRREPIYMSDEALSSDKHEAYRNAILRCPPLSKLRSQFLGRVTHSGFDAWKRSLDAYIK